MQATPCQYFKRKLTTDYIERVKADTDLQVSDTEVPGYHLRYATKTGGKVFYLHYILRLNGMKKERNLKLGVFPEIAAPDARAEAIKCRGQILDGVDPMFERRERLRKQMGEQDKKIPLKVLMEKYLEEHSKVFKKPQTSRKEFQIARKHIIPALGNIPIDEINVRNLEKMHQTIGETTKTQANHCLLMVSYFLNWCEKQEYRQINTNPVRLIRKFKTKGRDRVLSDDEYRRVFEAMDLGRRTNILNPVGFDILTFIIFTGCRSVEAKKLTWDEVDFDNSLLRLKDSKTGAKSVPIGRRALNILKAALRNKTSETSPVFPNTNGKAFSETAPLSATNKIRALNDFVRRNIFAPHALGEVVLTAGVSVLNDSDRFSLVDEVRCFEDFNEGNDPYGEHDFGAVNFKGERYFFKLDYYDDALRARSPDPANPFLTRRVLTIMRADEY
jgi:integrase